ncbi:zinc finger MYM-type protein 1-like [Macrobrachium rosenbergii]|uniref:zinc finger MYM-type protein 1-like n=1 Tax=Macrobrachium rosenbergii TaxID=79674 RepID=UPI0034D78A5B
MDEMVSRSPKPPPSPGPTMPLAPNHVALQKDPISWKLLGLCLDSPVLSIPAHMEQMSETVRYVDINFETKTVTVKETFLGFTVVKQKDAASIVEVICNQLEKDNMPLKYCRSQCYDNAAVMAGHKSGVQRITEKNSKTVFVNCDNHSLNLAGIYAASEESVTVTFFDTLDALYNFFSRSTMRWDKLRKAMPTTLKSESETRWNARAEAVKPVCHHFDDLLILLEEMSIDLKENVDTRSEASQLLHRILTCHFLALLFFLNLILLKIDRIQKRLQGHQINFHNAAKDLKALEMYFNENREAIYNESLSAVLELCENYNVMVALRTRIKKRMPGETAADVVLSAKQEIMRLMKSTIDRLRTEMKQRSTRPEDIDSKFGFLLDVEQIL